MLVSLDSFVCVLYMISSNSNALAAKYQLITGALTFLSVLRLAIFYSRMMILRSIWLSTFRLYLLHYSSESILRLPPWQLSSRQLTLTRIWTPRSPMKRLVHWPMSRAIPILLNSGWRWRQLYPQASCLIATVTSRTVVLVFLTLWCSSTMVTSLEKPFRSLPVFLFLSSKMTMDRSMASGCFHGR